MRTRHFHLTVLAAALVVVCIAAVSRAYACACCTTAGQRNVNIDKLLPERLQLIDKLRFVPKAELVAGERDIEDFKGIEKPSLEYGLAVTRQKGGFVFAFRDENGNQGTLTLARPETISIFEVDPRQPFGDSSGFGPRLYKEWRLTANFAGTGIFRSGNGGYQRITLIFQGSGASCPDAGDFTHWTLVVHGPAHEYTFHGTLEKPKE
jgi:hypothetical protein